MSAKTVTDLLRRMGIKELPPVRVGARIRTRFECHYHEGHTVPSGAVGVITEISDGWADPMRFDYYHGDQDYPEDHFSVEATFEGYGDGCYVVGEFDLLDD